MEPTSSAALIFGIVGALIVLALSLWITYAIIRAAILSALAEDRRRQGLPEGKPWMQRDFGS